MKQTAVEWLYNELFPKQIDGFSESEWKIIDKAFEQAKEMEKKQIIDANEDASTNELGEFLTGKQYYNKEYGGEQWNYSH